MEYMASLDLALENEKAEMDFYLYQASRSKNRLAKRMFNALAKDEQEHIARIRRLHARLLEDGQWPADVPIRVRNTRVRMVLKELIEKCTSDEEDCDDNRALVKAIEFEAKGCKFYAELARACSGRMERNFFEFLSRIERQHQLSLVDTLAYLNDPEGWFQEHEHSVLNGA